MNTLSKLYSFSTVLEAQADDGWIFGLDMQFLVDALIAAAAMLVLFVLLSYLLFDPARELMKARQDRINKDIEDAKKEKADALQLKADYDEKLSQVDKECDEILSAARKKALKRENEIIDEAKAESGRIIARANKEAQLERNKMQDEVKKEMVAVATAMAGKIISTSITENQQEQLIDDTLKEMGDKTWQN